MIHLNECNLIGDYDSDIIIFINYKDNRIQKHNKKIFIDQIKIDYDTNEIICISNELSIHKEYFI